MPVIGVTRLGDCGGLVISGRARSTKQLPRPKMGLTTLSRNTERSSCVRPPGPEHDTHSPSQPLGLTMLAIAFCTGVTQHKRTDAVIQLEAGCPMLEEPTNDFQASNYFDRHICSLYDLSDYQAMFDDRWASAEERWLALKELMQSNNKKNPSSDHQLSCMIKMFDANNDGLLSKAEFCSVVAFRNSWSFHNYNWG